MIQFQRRKTSDVFFLNMTHFLRGFDALVIETTQESHVNSRTPYESLVKVQFRSRARRECTLRNCNKQNR